MGEGHQPKEITLLVEADGRLFTVSCLDPQIYHLGVHFALEALRWEEQLSEAPRIVG